LLEQTVRSVASGILGVALIQALLAGLGFLVAGVPAAGLLTLVCLVAGRSNRVDPCSDLSVFNSRHGYRGRIPDLGHPSCTSGQYPQAPPTGPRRRRSHADHLCGRHRRLSQCRNHRPLYRRRRLSPRLFRAGLAQDSMPDTAVDAGELANR